MNTVYHLNCQDPWFTYIKQGKKKIEGRLNAPKYSLLKSGDVIRFSCPTKNEHIDVVVEKIEEFATLNNYLEKYWQEALPNIENIEKGREVYQNFYTKVDLEKHKFLAITITPFAFFT